MSAFADTSALVRLYVAEPGHRDVRVLGEPLLVSQLGRVEVPAAFWLKHRIGELPPVEAAGLVATFETDWHGDRFAVVLPSAEVLEAAARLVGVHGLRAYDGVQLATALVARIADPDCRTFVAFDDDLRAAAAAEGFTVSAS
ncbi:MAG: type II toxin-antitoxin system VapC family toxin [Actinomycetota bacterium]|nr:type II toxin-antitoxin system VapC family toxin [Actinomycetota bacterium]